jgi:exosome complex component MTR3
MFSTNESEGSIKAMIGGEIWIDPTEEESRGSNGTLVLACMPALKVVTSVWQSGQMTAQQAVEVIRAVFCVSAIIHQRNPQCMDICEERCTDIHSVVAQALLEGFDKQA